MTVLDYDATTQSTLVVGFATVVTAGLTAALADARAFGRVLNSSGILVPAAMSVGVFLTLRAFGGPASAIGTVFTDDVRPIEIGALVFQAILLAGLTGLLEARHRRQPLDGLTFSRGVIDHSLTFVLAVAILAVIHRIAVEPAERAWGLGMLLLVPSLMMAPLLAIATRYPRQPITAIREAAQLSLRAPGTCARPVVAMGTFLVVESVLLNRYLGVRSDEFIDYVHNPILSFHSLPFAAFRMPELLIPLVTIASGFVSTVCLTSCRERTELQIGFERSSVR